MRILKLEKAKHFNKNNLFAIIYKILDDKGIAKVNNGKQGLIQGYILVALEDDKLNVVDYFLIPTIFITKTEGLKDFKYHLVEPLIEEDIEQAYKFVDGFKNFYGNVKVVDTLPAFDTYSQIGFYETNKTGIGTLAPLNHYLLRYEVLGEPLKVFDFFKVDRKVFISKDTIRLEINEIKNNNDGEVIEPLFLITYFKNKNIVDISVAENIKLRLDLIGDKKTEILYFLVSRFENIDNILDSFSLFTYALSDLLGHSHKSKNPNQRLEDISFSIFEEDLEKGKIKYLGKETINGLYKYFHTNQI